MKSTMGTFYARRNLKFDDENTLYKLLFEDAYSDILRKVDRGFSLEEIRIF